MIPHLHGSVLLAIESINVFVEIVAIKATLERTETLECLAEGFDVFNGWYWTSDDSGQESEQDHCDGSEEDDWTKEHLEWKVVVCFCV